MAYSERTFIREVLIVRPEPSSPWAAHQVPITEVLNGGKVIAAHYGAPEALDPAKIGKVLEPAFCDLVTERDRLAGEVTGWIEANNDITARLAEAEAAINFVTAERDVFKAERDILLAERAAREAAEAEAERARDDG